MQITKVDYQKYLEYGAEGTPVFVKEHLTGSKKQLLGAAIAQKKRAEWMLVWTAGGKIFARKTEETTRGLKI